MGIRRMGKKLKKKVVKKVKPDSNKRKAPPTQTGGDGSDGEDVAFEDPFEDDIEQEEQHVANEAAEGQDGEGDAQLVQDDEMEDDAPAEKKQAFRPGIDTMEEDEELQYDSSAYLMYHALNSPWPCMSFDIYRDSLGLGRTKFPHTAYLLAGTQASADQENHIMMLKLSDMHKTKHDDNSEADSESEDDDLDDDPILESRTVKHNGGVNRIRSLPQHPHIVASWSDTGRVYVNDLSDHILSLDRAPEKKLNPNKPPIFEFGGHAMEGFAMDWSSVVDGRLVTGDCSKFIYLWEPQEGGAWNVSKLPFTGHTASVEDLSWSPVEQNVFASCSVDKTIRVWDTRSRDKPALTVQAHDMDVNVISWNATVNYLMVSGCDDGSFRIWDLRTFSNGVVQPAAHFQWHKGPITSVEFHPSDGSVVAVAGADDQITIWDLSLEREDGVDDLEGVPPQLLFVHQGQTEIKEVHWHKQIPGVLVSTAGSGFNVFKPDNIA
eukprot:c39258_g1_i1.p1 GENE.c39258_g1_i1~~c39258_g1_i1.p1  ORF type:complete len:491 (-),score=107.78 c39258_g1_i1:114-1586(-)